MTSTLMMEEVSTFETLVSFYVTTWRNTPRQSSYSPPWEPEFSQFLPSFRSFFSNVTPLQQLQSQRLDPARCYYGDWTVHTMTYFLTRALKTVRWFLFFPVLGAWVEFIPAMLQYMKILSKFRKQRYTRSFFLYRQLSCKERRFLKRRVQVS
jgi:hypothetical protein